MARPIQIERESFRPSYRPETRPGAIDPAMMRLGLFAAAIGGGVALLLGGSALFHGHHGGIPVVEADPGPVRIKPANPGGMQVTGAELSTQGGATQLAPAPEQPEIQALRAQLRAMKKELAKQQALTTHSERVAESAVKVAEKAETRIAAVPPVQRASITSAPVKTAPSVAAIVTAPKVAAPSVTAPISAPGTTVQLAALGDQKAARAAWDKLLKEAPQLLGDRHPEITHAEGNGHAIWRLRTGGFSSVAEATSFCAHLRAHGADCSIAAF